MILFAKFPEHYAILSVSLSDRMAVLKRKWEAERLPESATALGNSICDCKYVWPFTTKPNPKLGSNYFKCLCLLINSALAGGCVQLRENHASEQQGQLLHFSNSQLRIVCDHSVYREHRQLASTYHQEAQQLFWV